MRIRVRVAPNAKREEVTGEGDYFVVRVKEPPKEGKANRAVIKALALHFKVPQSSVSISSGFKSKDKIVEISGLDAGSSR
jgi:hypothetical protein